MAQATTRIVSGTASTVHDEPHVEGRRVTVRRIHDCVEESHLDPAAVASAYDLEIATVYEALAYYHRNEAEMRRVEEAYEAAGEKARRLSTLTLPGDDGLSADR